MRHLPRSLAGRALVLTLGALAVLGATRMASTLLQASPAGFPVPVPIYEIEATSGSHTASLLNLPIGQPGVPVVPMPVDADGDLVPDVNVTVSLINTNGLLQNPPRLGDVIVPNLEISRSPIAMALNKTSPPLRILVKLTVVDSESGVPTTLRFGYDTGLGGSIPQFWQARAGGLDTFFDPIEAVLDTKGTYEGPLHVLAEIASAGESTKLDFHYRPFPRAVRVTYSADDAGGHHLDYSHDRLEEVDLTATITTSGASGSSVVSGRIDRLPRSVGLDVAYGSGAGSLDYVANADGRLPDVAVDVNANPTGMRPLHAKIDLEGLPPEMHATWAFPTDGPASATLEATGAGIGAVEARLDNLAAPSTELTPFVATERQFLSVQSAEVGTDEPERLVSARIERVRRFELVERADGLDLLAELGDGELPLEAHLVCKHTCDEKDTLQQVVTTAAVRPLPDHFELGLTVPAEDASVPAGTPETLSLVYDASQSADVDARVEVLRRGRFHDDPTCGALGTVCIDAGVRRVPAHFDTTLVLTTTPASTTTPGSKDTRVSMTAEPRVGGAPADVFVDATIGGDGPGDLPTIAHGELFGVPAHASMRMLEIVTAGDEAAGTEPSTSLARAEFHACNWLFDAATPGCEAGTVSKIAALGFALRNFIDRPADLPPPAPTTPLYASLVGRGAAFEAAGRVTDIEEVQFRNQDRLTGLRTRLGGGNDLRATVDVRDADGGDGLELGDDLVLDDVRIDLFGDATIEQVPTELDLCFREPGGPTASPDAFTDACEAANPFDDPDTADDDADVPEEPPMSIGYAANAGIGRVQASVEAHITGAARVAAGIWTTYDATARASLEILDVPRWFNVHIQTPPGDAIGRVRALYKAEQSFDVKFAAEKRTGDATCLDPRDTVEAFCVRGLLEHVPERATLDYDPTLASDNLTVTADGPMKMNVKDLRLSTIDHGETIVVRGQVLGLPGTLEGTLLLPEDEGDATTIDLTATPAIDQIDVDVRNFVTPDPTPKEAPAPRAGVPAAPQTIDLYQRGDAFRAEMHIKALAAFGYRPGRDADGRQLDSVGVTVDLDTPPGEPPPVIRAFADLESEGSHTIADVTLAQLPDGIDLCFRGRKAAFGDPVDPGFCDSVPADNEGAFHMRGRGAGLSGMDVDAYIRIAGGGNTDVVAGQFHVVDVPFELRGIFPGGEGAGSKGSLDVSAFEDDGITPQGFGLVDFELASFDLPASGYAPDVEKTLFARRAGAPGPFPVKVPADPDRFHLSVASSGGHFHADGRIAGLQRVAMADAACPAPAGHADYPLFPAPTADYPATYTCVAGAFVNQGAAPLDLYAVVDTGDERMLLDEAGLTSIPNWFQINIAETEPLTVTGALRPRCGPAAGSNPADCMAPLVRFDSSGDSTVFGRLEFGATDNVVDLRAVPPFGLVSSSDLNEVPGPGDNGARVKLGVFGGDDEGVAMRAGLRIDVPGSMTVDQVQSWDKAENTSDATDLKFHYVVKDYSTSTQGDVVPSIGRMHALIHMFNDGTQIVATGGILDDGVVVPGEVDLGVYLRSKRVGSVERILAQIEGRISAPMNATAGIFGGPDATIGELVLGVRHLPAVGADTGPGEPSFRLQTEIIREDAAPDDPKEREECNPVLCADFGGVLSRISAELDFKPLSGLPAARLVKAVVKMVSPAEVYLHAQAFTRIDPALADFEHRAHFTMAANAEITDLYVSIHAGIPGLGSLDFIMDGDIDVGFEVRNAYAFRAGINVMRFEGNVSGDGTSDEEKPLLTLGPIDPVFNTFSADAWALLIHVYGLLLVPPGGEPIDVDFFPCDAGEWSPGQMAENVFLGLSGSNSASSDAHNDLDIVIWPLDDPRLIATGLNLIFDPLAEPIAQGVMCAALDAGPKDLINANHPGDPLSLADHVVPGAPTTTSYVPEGNPPATQPPDRQDDTISTPPGQLRVLMCGLHYYRHLTIDTTIVVPTDRTLCPKEVGRGTLTLDAETITITANGRILADDIIGPGPFDPSVGSVFPDVLPWSDVFAAGRAPWDLYPADFGSSNSPFIVDYGAYHAQNGGAGHVLLHGLGGAGSDTHLSLHNKGLPYADDPSERDLPTASPGWQGGSPTGQVPGLGGGVVTLTAEKVVVDGKIDVSAGDGHDNPLDPVQCADLNGPHGPGGGSGGSIVLNTPVAYFGVDAELVADGGDGGDGARGGGGGGAGGIIKLFNVVTHDAGAFIAAFGGFGGQSCSALTAGGHGSAGIIQPAGADADSRAKVDEPFWRNSNPNVEVGYAAAVSTTSRVLRDPNNSTLTSSGFDVVLCGVRKAFDAPNTGPPAIPPLQSDLILAAQLPCGQPTGHILGHAYHASEPDEQVLLSDAKKILATQPNPAGPVTDQLDSGYWGVWTMVLKPRADGKKCAALEGLVTQDDIYRHDPFMSGEPFPPCLLVSNPPPTPDAIFGVDNVEPRGGPDTDGDGFDQPPMVAMVGPSLVENAQFTTSANVVVTITAEDVILGAPVSGIDTVECSVGEDMNEAISAPRFPCLLNKPFEFSVRGSSGSRTHLRAWITDHAGNLSWGDAEILLDTTDPDADAHIETSQATFNGWYTTKDGMKIVIDSFSDGIGSGSGKALPADGVPTYIYRFDDGAEHDCFTDPCVIEGTDLPEPGRHVLRYTAIDRAGNRRYHDPADPDVLFPRPQMETLELLIDDEAPLVDASVAPDEPESETGWYTSKPWLGIHAFDRPIDGSGVEDPPGAPVPTAGIWYSTAGPAGAESPYSGPVRLADGEHHICFRARDVAGHHSHGGALHCPGTVVRVDTTAPTVTLSASPASPNGSNGWYTSTPTVTLGATDPIAGSGFDPTVPTSGLFVSVDGAPYAKYTGTITIAEGVHTVAAYAVDVAGNRGDAVVMTLRVDLSHPVSEARVLPPEPARADWWRGLPRVVLRATDGDDNAGVEKIEYRIGSGPWTTYQAPFAIGAGVTTVEYRAHDRSGAANLEPIRTLVLPVDVTPPTALATTANPSLWSRTLGPATAKLNWVVGDSQSTTVSVKVVITNVLGDVVRRIDAGTFSIVPGVPLSGFTLWDGKDESLLGLVPVGFYNFRVLVTDSAGNVAMSGPSARLQIKLL